MTSLRSLFLALLLPACASAGSPDDPTPGDPSDPGSPGDPGNPGDPSDPGGRDPDDNDVQPSYPTEHPRIYLTPNRARLEAALAANTSPATRFRAKVDAWVAGEDIWGFNSWNAALLGQLTGDPKYCTAAIADVESQVSAAEAAIAGGNKPAVAGDSYLEIGELVGDLALVYDWCFDQVTSAQRTRWLAYANQAIWNVWHPDEAKWGGKSFPWSGWSVDNPSNNYYYSFLRATMLVGLAAKGESPQADDWITQFRDTKIYGQLLPTFDEDLVGGGSREGTGYGVSMRRLFELYDFWKATTGESLATKTGHTRASFKAFMHQIMPTLDRIAPTGDHARDHTAPFFDYQRNYLQELIALFPTDPMAGPAKTLLAQSNVPQMGQGFMLAYDFLYDTPAVTAAPLDTLPTDYRAAGIGQLYSRSGWDKHATWINLIAGPYTESHAHQDQGSIMIFKDGWLADDANLTSRSGLAQDTTAHGLVRIDSGGAPIKQVASTMSSLAALHSGDGWLHAEADVTAAYKNNAAVQLVQRELVYLKPDVAIVFDRVRTSAGTTQTWQLPTPTAPAISGTTATITGTGHTLKVTRLQPAAATASSTSYTGEFTGGFRLDERIAGGDQRYLHVLAIDSAAVSIVASGPTGVTVRLSDGRVVDVAFERDSIGATLTIDGAATTLAAGVDALPE
jgi:hypothetical protein